MKKRGEDYYTVRIKENKEGSTGLPDKKKVTGEELILLEKNALNVFSQSSNIESGGLGRVSSLRDAFETSQSSQIWDLELKNSLTKENVDADFIFSETSSEDKLEVDHSSFSNWDNPNYTLNDIKFLSSKEYKPNGDELILLGSSDKNLLYKNNDKLNHSHTFSTTISNAVENYNIDESLFDIEYNDLLISLTSNNILSDAKIIDRLDEDVWLISLKLNLTNTNTEYLNRFSKSFLNFSREYLDSDSYKGFAITTSVNSIPYGNFRLYDWNHFNGNSVFDLKAKSSDTIYIWYGTKFNWTPISCFNMADIIDGSTPSSYFADFNNSEYNRVFVASNPQNVSIELNNSQKMNWLDRDLKVNSSITKISGLSDINAYDDDLNVDKFKIESVMIFNPRIHQIGYEKEDFDPGYGKFSALGNISKISTIRSISVDEKSLYLVCKGYLEIENKKGYMVFKDSVTINTL